MPSDDEPDYGIRHVYPTPDEAMATIFTYGPVNSHESGGTTTAGDNNPELVSISSNQNTPPKHEPVHLDPEVIAAIYQNAQQQPDLDGAESDDEPEDPLLGINPNDEERPNTEDEEASQVEPEPFEIQTILDKMSTINLYDLDDMFRSYPNRTDGLNKFITDELTDVECSSLELTEERMENILDSLPVSHAALQTMYGEEEISQAISRYRRWVAEILDNIVLFFLAARARKNLPVDMTGSLLFILANATPDRRQRIVKVFTHSAIVSLSFQYACGQTDWGFDMFDNENNIDLQDPGAAGDCVTAYAAMAHGTNGKHYLYSGSATNTNPNLKQIGEELRMKQHADILKLGKDEVLRRRRAGVSNIFRVHESLVTAGMENSFFFPVARISVDVRDRKHMMAAVLIHLHESVTMILLGTASSDSVPRRGRAVQFMIQSNKLMKRLRPKDCPVPPWMGTNRVLPLLQIPKGVFNLLREGHRLAPKPELAKCLRDHFEQTKALFLPEQLCKEILQLNNRPSARPDVCTLRRFYAALLNEEGLTYTSDYETFLKERCVL
ncbi:hypothetical protein NW762_006886 [Fusarium torreyae]|uniref:Uncharacterized protein n=1 Tax=Fusarium torreyae TaxID=1237075 RepID=A0A9W8RZZ4_9HYPO|nr:hypothetical protein NW762_006886 [Fusarium torreyae]